MAQLETLTGQVEYKYDGAGMKDAIKDVKELDGAYQDANGRWRDANGKFLAGMGQADKATKGGTMGMLALKGGALAAGAAVAGVGIAAVGVGAGLAGAIGKAATFESGLSNIKAVSGATAQEMDQVKDAALRIGAETSFSAQEAAGAIEELVKAGVSVEGVLNGAADAAVALAAAGEVDMATAASVAGAAMNNFGLAAEDLPRVADLVAGAANASAMSVEDFAYGLSAAGAVANTVGFSFDDLSVAMTAMGNAGILGSDAGTSLKTMFMNLQPQTDKQIALFNDLGLMMENGSSAFFDAEGNIRSMAEVAGILQDALGGMTKQQQLSTLEMMFGSDAIRAGAVLMEEGAAGIESLAGAMTKVSAADVAKERLNNLTSSVDAFWGSLETLQIKAGSAFTPILKVLTDFGTEALNALGPVLDQLTPMIEGWFSGIDVAAMFEGLSGGDLSGIMGSFGEIGENLSAAFSDPATQTYLSDLFTRLKDVGMFIKDFIIPTVMDMAVAWSEQFATVLPIILEVVNVSHDLLWPIIKQIFDFLVQHQETIGGVFSLAVAPLNTILDMLSDLKAAFDGLGDITFDPPDVGGWLGGLFGGGEAEAAGAQVGADFAAAAAEGALAASSAGAAATGLAAIFGGGEAEAEAAGKGIAIALADGLASIGGEETPPFLAALSVGFREFHRQTEEFGLGPLDALANSMMEVGESFDTGWLADAGLALGDLSNQIAGFELPDLTLPEMPEIDLSGLTDPFANAWAEIQSGIDSAWAEFDATIQSAQDAIYSYLLDIWMQIPEDIREDLILIAEHIREQFEQYRADIEAKLQEAKDGITDWLGEVKDAWDTWLDGIVTAASDAWEDVKAAIMGPLAEARSELSSAWADVEADARAAWSQVQAAVSDAVNQALSVLTGIKDQIAAKARDAWSQVVTAASTALSPLVSAVTDKVNAALSYLSGVRDTVEGKAREIWDGFISATESALDRFKDAVLTPIREGIDNIKSGVASSVARVLEVGRDIVDGIKRGIDTRLAQLKSSFWDSIRGIIDWLKGLLGIKSPSTLFAEIGLNLMQGLAMGVMSGAGLVQSALSSAFGGLITGDPTGDIGDAVAKMDELHAEWVRLAEVARQFNETDPLAGPIRRMNEALTAFFDGDGAGSLADLLKMMTGEGYTVDEGGLLERFGFSERSFEEIQRSIDALSGEPERQAKLWGDFIDALMSDWESFYEAQKAPHEARKRQLEAEKKLAERDPTRTGTELDPQIDAVQALIDQWDEANDAIERALSGQEDSVDGIAAAYKRVLEAVRAVNGAAEDAEEAYQAALKAAQAAVKAMQDSAEGAEDSAHDQAMRLLDAEERARERAHKAEMKRLEAHQAWVEADVARRIALEEEAHKERLAAITKEVDAEQKRLDAEEERIDLANEAIDRAKNLIDLIEQGGTITDEQAAFLRSMGIDPDEVRKVAAGIVQTRTEIDRLTASIEALKGLFEKLPDEIGRVRMAAGELRREFGRRPGSEGASVGAVSDAERKRLEDLGAGGTLSKSDQRIVDLFLAGRAVQSQRLREILGPRIGAEETALANEEKKTQAVQKQVDLAGDLLAKLEAQLKVDEDQLAIAQRLNDERRKGLQEAIDKANADFEAFKVRQEARISAVEAEAAAKKLAYDEEREAIAEAKRLEEERHDARMRQIQEEYALELLKLGLSDDDVQKKLAEQRARAQAIAEEAERRFREMMANAGLAPAAPGNPFVPPGGQPPPGIPTPPPGSGATEAMTFGEMFGDINRALAPALPTLTALGAAFSGAPAGGGAPSLTRDLTNYGVITVGDQGEGQRQFVAALLDFLGVGP